MMSTIVDMSTKLILGSNLVIFSLMISTASVLFIDPTREKYIPQAASVEKVTMDHIKEICAADTLSSSKTPASRALADSLNIARA